MSEDREKRAERRKLKKLKDNRRREICEDQYLLSMWYDDENGYIKYSGRSGMQHWLKRYNNRKLRRSTKDLYQGSVYKKVNEYWWILI